VRSCSGAEGLDVSVFLFAIWGALCFLLLPAMLAILLVRVYVSLDDRARSD